MTRSARVQGCVKRPCALGCVTRSPRVQGTRFIEEYAEGDRATGAVPQPRQRAWAMGAVPWPGGGRGEGRIEGKKGIKGVTGRGWDGEGGGAGKEERTVRERRGLQASLPKLRERREFRLHSLK